MEDEITVGVQLLLEDGVSDALAAIMRQLAAADQAVTATSANWEGIHPGSSVPLSPVPILPEKFSPQSSDIAVADYDVPYMHSSSGEPQAFAAPIMEPAPLVPLDEVAPRPEPLPTSYAPLPPDLSATDGAWLDSALNPSDLGFDPASMLTLFPAAPIDDDYARSASPVTASNTSPNLSTISAAPIPTDDRSNAAPSTLQPSDPEWQTQPPLTYAPLLPPPADSIAPRDIDPAKAARPATDLAPTGGGAADPMATAPLAEAGGGEGQLMLDGSLLGRWVIDHLSREADRPPAWGTAFDSRQGR